MNVVDEQTKKKLLECENSAAIWQVLTKGVVDWQTRSRCLTHPDEKLGCDIDFDVDLDARLKYNNHLTWKPSKSYQVLVLCQKLQYSI